MAWPVPKFEYMQKVKLIPNDRIECRVCDLHIFTQTGSVEYDVRYFQDGKDYKVRVFEDELEAC